MSYVSVADSITSFFHTSVATVESFDARYPNDPRENPDTFPWAEVDFDFGNSQQITLGVKQFRTSSLLQVRLHGELGIGVKSLLELAVIIRSYFNSVTIDAVAIFQTPRIELIGRYKSECRINVICPFHWTET